MGRRRFLLNSLASARAAPLAAGAQPAGKVYRIGFLGPGTPITFAPGIEALRLGLRDHGYVEGRNITINAARVAVATLPPGSPR
jgi:putative ABC transport system substrate-binding protein